MSYYFEYFKQHIFAVIIGVLGFLSAIVTIFVDVSESISVKWLIFTIFISLVMLVLFINFIIENIMNQSHNENINRFKLKALNQETERGEVFLNKSTVNFEYGDVVKIYYLDRNKVENFIGIGVVEYIQQEQNICHIDFIWKNELKAEMKDVYFSLKINKDELKSLMNKEY